MQSLQGTYPTRTSGGFNRASSQPFDDEPYSDPAGASTQQENIDNY